MTEPMIMKARTSAPVKEVRHALTDPAALRQWLADEVDVDLPRTFAFWGRHVPEGDAPHQRLLHADDDTIRFAWTLDGVETTSEISLAEDGDGTLITVTQTGVDVQAAMTESSIRGVLYTYWYMIISGLVDLVEGRGVGPRADFTSGVLEAEIVIAAPQERVYAALTESDQAAAWFGYPIGIEPHEGGRFAMGGFDAGGPAARIFDVTEGRGMSIDFGTSITTWELEGTGGKTRLTFSSSGFDTPPYSGWVGWLSGLAELRRYLEIPDWTPVWTQA